MCSSLCDPYGDLAEGHLIVLNVHSDNEKSLDQHCEVDKRRYEENYLLKNPGNRPARLGQFDNLTAGKPASSALLC